MQKMKPEIDRAKLIYCAQEKRSWPQRVLLHDHLDGSIAMMAVLEQLHHLSGKPYPFTGTLKEQHQQIKALFNNAQINIVEKFANTTGVMQSAETLSLAAESYVRVRDLQGYKYCEATIAPQYHTFGGLNEREVIAALIEGIKRGEERCPYMEVNLIFTIGREVDPDLAVRLVEQAALCERSYVVGIGLACDEAAHPPEKHKKMFRRAKELGFKTTCHAGEWVSVKPDYNRDQKALLKNIRTAIFDLRVDRIGHAIPLAFIEKWLLKHIAKEKIGIEGCPGSNFASKLIPNTRYLEIRYLLGHNVCYSLNPDDDLFLPSLDETWRLVNREYNFTRIDQEKLMMNAWTTRFGNRKNHVMSLW